MSDWRPTASLTHLQDRACVLTQVREFFAQRRVLEVETPLACLHTVTDPNIESYSFADHSNQRYLQTSPEYAMKRLLAAGASDIYQICKCFRQGEQGDLHNPEFTMIEWYRLDQGLEQIMQETVELITQVLKALELSKQVEYVTYTDLFSQSLGVSFADLAENDIDQICTQHGLQSVRKLSLAQKVDFIFSHVIAAKLNSNAITCVYHYPAEQAALARLNPDDDSVADRFEVFAGGVELANGYVELIDADIQLARFESDQLSRTNNNLTNIEIDQRLIDAQKHGLPECAGVALGFDRLLMLALGATSISQVMSFSWDNA